MEKFDALFRKLSKHRLTRPFAKLSFHFCYDFLASIYKLNMHQKIRHISGLKNFESSRDNVVVCCLVRDGEEYIESFLEYYLSTLKVDHVFFLDNGSVDNTIELAKTNKRVTIYQTTLEFKTYKHILKRYMIENFSNGGWILYVDVDEFYDFPYSNIISLSSLIGYLNLHSYTAVAAYLLDMVPKEAKIFSTIEDSVFNRSDFEYYDLSEIHAGKYGNGIRMKNNIVSNASIKSYAGGIRKKLFNISPNLLKHPLLFYDKKIKTYYGSHSIVNAYVADISSILYHYKFTAKFMERVDKAIKEKNYYCSSIEYKAYKKGYENPIRADFSSNSLKKLKSIDDLIKNDFLQVTSSYKNWVAVHGM